MLGGSRNLWTFYMWKKTASPMSKADPYESFAFQDKQNDWFFLFRMTILIANSFSSYFCSRVFPSNFWSYRHKGPKKVSAYLGCDWHSGEVHWWYWAAHAHSSHLPGDRHPSHSTSAVAAAKRIFPPVCNVDLKWCIPTRPLEKKTTHILHICSSMYLQALLLFSLFFSSIFSW